MCGIVGSISQKRFENSSETFSFKLSQALNALSHRGPDDVGQIKFHVDNWVLYLGQTRLSIIDLSNKGHQPFVSPDGKYSIVFNGEIYNYLEIRHYLTGVGFTFYTQSDTEVLLNAWIHWGIKCLSKLKGMFAFAVYDQIEKTITLVRDAFGIKPLFYLNDGKNFLFASELNALRQVIPHKVKPSKQKMFDFLAFGSYDFDGDTFFEDIKTLEPGHILEIKMLDFRMTGKPSRWWWPDNSQNPHLSNNKSIGEVRRIFLENINMHLRSDVPLGAALSGGLDSSSIVCAMRYLEPRMDINTFSFVSPGSKKNEEMWVDLVNQFVGGKAHKVLISPHELAEDLDDMITYQGEPFGSTSIYAQYRVYKLAREKGVTVILDGQGADELFAGYAGFPEWRIRSLISRGSYSSALRFLINWSKGPGRTLSLGLRNTAAIYTPEFLVPLAYKFSSQGTYTKIFNTKKLLNEGIEVNYPLNATRKLGHNRALTSRLRYAMTENGLSQLLRHGDRNSMRWSIESRVPFLTTDLAEFALRLPEESLISYEGITKNIFREAMKGIVPDQILNRKDKIGFETPELDWLSYLRFDIDIWLDCLKEVSWINLDQARAHINEVIDGAEKFSWQSWRLINMAKWIQLIVHR